MASINTEYIISKSLTVVLWIMIIHIEKTNIFHPTKAWLCTVYACVYLITMQTYCKLVVKEIGIFLLMPRWIE